MNKINTADQLINLIKEKNVYIYGAGFVGERFYYALQKYGIGPEIRSFVVTEHSGIVCCGLKVQSLSDVIQVFNHDTDLICIATHESICSQIVERLDEVCIKEYVWIYPFFHELAFGKPIKENVEIPLKELLSSYKKDYAIPLRILAIEQFYGKNDNGYELYKKGMELHCGEVTAKRRLSQFIELIQKWEKDGYDRRSRIKITEEGDIFDGVHRLSLACYHGCDYLNCDMYHVDDYGEFITAEVRITEKDLHVFSLEEREQLRTVSDYINSYGVI